LSPTLCSLFMPLERKVCGWLWSGSRTASFICKSMTSYSITVRSNRWKSKRATFALWTGCLRTPNLVPECCWTWDLPCHVPEHPPPPFCANSMPQFIPKYVAIITLITVIPLSI
jgi:hypothetical protein